MLTNRENAGEQPTGAPRRDGYSETVSDAVRRHAEQVLTDPLFRNSQRYCNLLRFIVDRTLKGQNQDLKERVIGFEVFGRSPDYDTSADPTVRVAANEVRKRLINYYSKAGHDQQIRIDIPLGSYVAEFSFTESKLTEPKLEQPAQTQPVPEPKPELKPERKPLYRQWYAWGTATAVIVALAVWAGLRAFTPQPAIDRFWSPVLGNSGPVLLCISSASLNNNGAPGAATNQSASGGNEIPLWQFSQQSVNVNVGMMDVNAANELSAYLGRKGKVSVLKPSTETSLADLRSQPAVIYGGLHNEWSMRLQSDLHFHFREETDRGFRWIEDASNPASRNWSMNLSAPYEKVGTDYALITRAQNPNTGQWWVGIGGLTGQATRAANQLLIDPPSVFRMTKDLPKDWDTKNLQMVLEIEMVQGSAGAPRVIATYSW